jgi:hypothetical protein
VSCVKKWLAIGKKWGGLGVIDIFLRHPTGSDRLIG